MNAPTRSVVRTTLIYAGVALAWLDPVVTWASYRYIHGGSWVAAALVVSFSLALVSAVAFFVHGDLTSRSTDMATKASGQVLQ